MQWVEPSYTKQRVNWAGEIITSINPSTLVDDLSKAYVIINNWRASHSFPLNTFQNGLRKKARHVDHDCIVAQRIKRFPSIVSKMIRFKTMKLSQMQDIGGCRAIVGSTEKVMELRDIYLNKSKMKHELHHVDDYIKTPKESGYRGIHLIYRYKSDRKETYNTLLLEVQLRSISQHAWATAVETVGMFVGQALKSSIGEVEWLDFFRLMSTGIAMLEETAPVPNTTHNKNELADAVSNYASALNIFQRLSRYSKTLNIIQDSMKKEHHFFLIELDSTKGETKIRAFRFGQSELASNEYAKAEERFKEQAGSDAVLVSVDSIAQLRRAYPNYFADTQVFLDLIKKITSRGK